MAELTVTDGRPPPCDLPDGECIVSAVNSRVRIVRADPRILISAEVLAETFVQPAPGVSLSQPSDGPNGTPFWEGAVLRIEGVNRTVVYRIGEYVPCVRGYIGEWPD